MHISCCFWEKKQRVLSSDLSLPIHFEDLDSVARRKLSNVTKALLHWKTTFSPNTLSIYTRYSLHAFHFVARRDFFNVAEYLVTLKLGIPTQHSASCAKPYTSRLPSITVTAAPLSTTFSIPPPSFFVTSTLISFRLPISTPCTNANLKGPIPSFSSTNPAR